MSFDFELYPDAGNSAQKCTHYVLQEYQAVRFDTVTLERPVVSANSVRVWLNEEISIPPTGLFVPARAVSPLKGPFKIPPSAQISIALRDGIETFTFGLVGTYPIEFILDRINGALVKARFDKCPNGYPFVVTREEGDQVVMQLEGTLAELLGFNVERVYRGAMLAPPWTLVSSHNGTDTPQRNIIVFSEPFRGSGDYVTVDYVTNINTCRRCAGVGYEVDWRYNAEGDPVEVRNEALLLQELVKWTLTLKGSNVFHPNYGTGLSNLIGSRSVGGIQKSLISSEIQNLFSGLQRLKREVEKVDRYPDREFPYRLVNVDIQEEPLDPTTLNVTVTVQNRAFNQTLRFGTVLKSG